MQQQLIALTDPAGMQAAGLPFRTTDAARWEFRQSSERGTAKAFVRIGRRIYIDPSRYHTAIRMENDAA